MLTTRLPLRRFESAVISTSIGRALPFQVRAIVLELNRVSGLSKCDSGRTFLVLHKSVATNKKKPSLVLDSKQESGVTTGPLLPSSLWYSQRGVSFRESVNMSRESEYK